MQDVAVGDAEAPTMLGASTPRSNQLEPGLAPVVIRLHTLASYGGVGDRYPSIIRCVKLAPECAMSMEADPFSRLYCISHETITVA